MYIFTSQKGNLFITILSQSAVIEKFRCILNLHTYTLECVNNFNIIMLPVAEAGDCSEGVTVSPNAKLDVPPTRSSQTITDPLCSEPVNIACRNITVISVQRKIN